MGLNIDIEDIKDKIKAEEYVISFTHTERLRVRKIEAHHIEEAICNGSIIESYSTDQRGHSCLIFGYTKDGRPLHIVCGNLSEKEILIITAYEPDPIEWETDWKTRRK